MKTCEALGLMACVLLAGCGPKGPGPAAPAPVEVTTVSVAPREVAVVLQYVGQAESSRSVEIRARVDGYLEKKFYTEGYLVQQGEPLFQIDPRPLQSAADSAAAAVQDKQSSAQNAKLARQRLQSLLAENAVSKKDLDDATTAEKSADAALASSRAEYARAGMNLSYARITAPMKGIASRSNLAEGTYVNPSTNGLLTTVAQIDPIWVNFSISENEWLRYEDELARGTLRLPQNFEVEMVLGDGRTLASRGKINFAAPSIDTQTGTYALRATFPNANLAVRPGQFVRVRCIGAVRPGAILVPQRAVMQGQAGKFVYIVSKDGKAESRPVEVGDWLGDAWFINSGLKGGEQIVVGGIVKVQQGALLKITAEPPASSTRPPVDASSAAAGKDATATPKSDTNK
jgi:membrane fusion protein (multidrug efflux system)